jgi:hypothetical protein
LLSVILMKHPLPPPSLLSRRALARAARFTLAGLVALVTGAASGCLTRPIEPNDPRTTSVVTEQLKQSAVDKIDLVLAVDNSASMADKQAILALAVPDLITGLVNPPCLDNMTNLPVAVANLKPTDTCPTGSTREFNPVLDIHIGLLSSSLGTFGVGGIGGCLETPSATCTATTTPTTPGDDHGHLVTRSDSCNTMGDIPTYGGQGFLAWDPAQKLTPHGIPDVATLQNSLRELVVGDGQSGCGFESQDESWYRFLIDPTPYKSITFQNNQVSVSGIDQPLLKQRQEFLRPDSLLAIIVVSDETDTSVKEYSFYPLVTATGSPLPNPRSGCNNGPNDPCCVTCGLPAPKGMGCLDPDPQCAMGAPPPMPSDPSLRAFGLTSHKQRFGAEFYYQPSRYVNALKSPTVADVTGKQVPNPIFTNLDPTNYSGAVRDSNLVFYAAIVGVPWQLIARQKNGVPDLVAGVSDIDATQVGGFKTARELTLLDKSGHSYWDDIVGDPENYREPLSPFMKEKTGPRSGVDPITGATIMPATTPNGMGTTVGGTVLNDHERTIATPVADIEYACIFPVLPNTNPCDSGVCDCLASPSDNPLCYPNPSDGGKNTLQKFAKAYPGLKELAIAHGMGDQGIAASICAKQLKDNTAADFGYRPAVKAIIDRLKLALNGQCLPRKLTPNMQGQVQCLILEGSKSNTCRCDTTMSRSDVLPEHKPAVIAAQAEPAGTGLNCFCEIDQAQGADLMDCQTKTPATSNGWCYVDADQGKAEAAIVSKCPPSQQRQIRFVGNGAPQHGATVFLTCAGD